jgi:hypothetical protein
MLLHLDSVGISPFRQRCSGFNQAIADVAEHDLKVHLFTPESMLVSE